MFDKDLAFNRMESNLEEMRIMLRAYKESLDRFCRKYERPAEPIKRSDGIFLCPECGKRVNPKHSHCHRCGKMIRRWEPAKRAGNSQNLEEQINKAGKASEGTGYYWERQPDRSLVYKDCMGTPIFNLEWEEEIDAWSAHGKTLNFSTSLDGGLEEDEAKGQAIESLIDHCQMTAEYYSGLAEEFQKAQKAGIKECC